MKIPLDALKFLMRPLLLSKCYGSFVVTVQQYGIRCHNLKFYDELFELEAFLCSIRSSDIFSLYGRTAIMGCLKFIQLTAPPLQTNTYPDVDFLSSGSDMKSESVYPLTHNSKPPSKIKNKSLVFLQQIGRAHV